MAHHHNVWLISVPTGRFADVGHEGVITGRDVFSLRSSIADPKESPSLHSNQLIYIVHSIRFNKHPQLLMDETFLSFFSLISEK